MYVYIYIFIFIHICIYICIYIYIYYVTCIYIYIYTHIERERDVCMYVCIHIYIYIHIYIIERERYTYVGRDAGLQARPAHLLQQARRARPAQLLFGWHRLSHAARLIRPQLLCARFVVSRSTVVCLQHDSPRLKTTCVRRVVSDKWFP